MSNLFVDFSKDDPRLPDAGRAASYGFFSTSPDESKKRKAPSLSSVNAIPVGGKEPKVQYLSSLMELDMSSDSPPRDNGIPSLLDLPAASPNANRPEDPLGNKLTPRDVFDTLSEQTKRILEQVKAARVANSEQTGRLKHYLNTVMHDGSNPFPVIRLFKEFIGSDQLGRVLNAGMVKKLDYYWEHWSLPPPGPDSAGAGKNQTSSDGKSGVNWMNLEKLRGRDEPIIVREDPLSYKPEEINGVARDRSTGKYIATYGTIKFIRSVAFMIHRSGKKEEQYEPFLDLMRGYFGESIVQKAINPAQAARNDRAAATFAEEQNVSDLGANSPTGKQSSESEFSASAATPSQQSSSLVAASSTESDELNWLMHHMTATHVPGLTGEEGREGFSPLSAKWIQEKIERMLALCLNPDSFVKKISAMFGERALRNVFTPEKNRDFAAGIRNLPTSVTEPAFLVSVIRQAGIDISNRPPLYKDDDRKEAASYGRPPPRDTGPDWLGNGGRDEREPLIPYGRPPASSDMRGYDMDRRESVFHYGRPRDFHEDRLREEERHYDYYDRRGPPLEYERERYERRKYDEYSHAYDTRMRGRVVEPPRLMPPPGPRWPAPRSSQSSPLFAPRIPSFLGVHMRMRQGPGDRDRKF